MIPAAVSAYAAATRALCRPSSAADNYRTSIHANFEDVMRRHGVFGNIEVVYVYSQSKVPEFVVKRDAAYVIYDQYGGQFLNMCNRLLLYQPSAPASAAYFHKILAEEIRHQRRSDMYVFFLTEYLNQVKAIPKPRGTRHHYYTLYQERFCLFHEAFHAAQALRPAVLSHITSEASFRIDTWRRKECEVPGASVKLAREFGFQDRFFGYGERMRAEREKEASLSRPWIEQDSHPDWLNALRSETAADIFAFHAVVDDVLQRTNLRNRVVAVRDAICACYSAFLHLRTLYEVRAMLEAGETTFTFDLLRSTPLIWTYNARSSVMHSLAVESLRHHVPSKLLEYDYPEGLAEIAEQTFGYPEQILTLMTLQKMLYAAVLDPFMRVADVALTEELTPDSYVADRLSSIRQKGEKELLSLGDDLWYAINSG